MNSIFDEPLPITDFDGSNLDEYILKINESNQNHSERKCLKEKIEGKKLFNARFIKDFKFSLDNCKVCIAAKVGAEMKKTSYDVNLTIASNNEVLDASCQCAGGSSPSECKHVFAVLHFVAEYCAKELHRAPTEVLRQWHQPSKKVCCSPKRVQDFIPPILLQKRPKKEVDFSALNKLPSDCPLFSVLEDSRFDKDEAIYASSIALAIYSENENSTDSDGPNDTFSHSGNDISFSFFS